MKPTKSAFAYDNPQMRGLTRLYSALESFPGAVIDSQKWESLSRPRILCAMLIDSSAGAFSEPGQSERCFFFPLSLCLFHWSQSNRTVSCHGLTLSIIGLRASGFSRLSRGPDVAVSPIITTAITLPPSSNTVPPLPNPNKSSLFERSNLHKQTSSICCKGYG